jgi:hypothetical protein
MDANHTLITKMFEEEANSLLKGIEEKQSTKKRTIMFARLIFKFFLSKIPSKKRMCCRKNV